MNSFNNTICVILAGGKGSRLDGKGKYREILLDNPLWRHVYRRVKSQSIKVAVNLHKKTLKKNSIPDNIDLIYDMFKEDIGPLAGIHAAMAYASKNKNNNILVCTVPVDTPFLPNNLLNNLYNNIRLKKTDVAVAMSNHRPHPTIALWKIKLKKILEDHINKGTRKIDKFTSDLNVSYVNWDTSDIDPFFNVNSYNDLKLAKNMLKK